jgi:integrase
MSVRVVHYGDGREVDIRARLANGKRLRERRVISNRSKSAAKRWGEERERHLLQQGPAQPKKEVPTLADFWPRFLDGHVKANRQKPSGVAAKEMIGRVHLLPRFGAMPVDAITTERVQQLKSGLTKRAAKTTNNVLTVLNMVLKKAVEWDAIERMPCTIGLLRVSKGKATFHDSDQYESLVEAAKSIDSEAYLIMLLGGEAGLRCGEMMALEWSDVDLTKRQLCIQRSDWNGQVTTPKSGRLRYVPMTKRLAAALRQHRHLRSQRVLCQENGTPFTRQHVQYRVKRAARRANVRDGVHILRHTFCSLLAMRGAPARSIQELAGHKDLGTTQRYMHLSPAALDGAIRLLESSGIPSVQGDSGETNFAPLANSNG